MAIQFKRYVKMERAVRLEALGKTDAEIAFHLSMSQAGLAQLKRDPQYSQIRTRVATGVISEADSELSNDLKLQRQRVRDLVPLALDALYDAVTCTDRKIKLSAASQILNRDGRLAEVSRIGLPTEDQGGAGNITDHQTAADLVAALEKSRKIAEQAKLSLINVAEENPESSVQGSTLVQ